MGEDKIKSKTTSILPEQLDFSEHLEQQPQQQQQKQELIIQSSQTEDNITNIVPTSSLTQPQNKPNNFKPETERELNPKLVNNINTT